MNVCVHILFQDIDKNLAFCKGRCQVYNGAAAVLWGRAAPGRSGKVREKNENHST